MYVAQLFSKESTLKESDHVLKINKHYSKHNTQPVQTFPFTFLVTERTCKPVRAQGLIEP